MKKLRYGSDICVICKLQTIITVLAKNAKFENALNGGAVKL